MVENCKLICRIKDHENVLSIDFDYNAQSTIE